MSEEEKLHKAFGDSAAKLADSIKDHVCVSFAIRNELARAIMKGSGTIKVSAGDIILAGYGDIETNAMLVDFMNQTLIDNGVNIEKRDSKRTR